MFPSLSVTDKVTVVVPTLKKLPLGGVAIISPEMLPSSGSIAKPAKFTTAPHAPNSLFAMMVPGQTIIGGLPTTKMGSKVIQKLFNVPESPPKSSLISNLQFPVIL